MPRRECLVKIEQPKEGKLTLTITPLGTIELTPEELVQIEGDFNNAMRRLRDS